MIRRRSHPRVDVELPGPGLAAVRMSMPAGGSGRPEAADRLDLMLGLLGWGVHRTHESEVRSVADRIRELATAIAQSPDGRVPPGTVRINTRSRGPVDVELVRWSGDRGLTRVTAEMLHSAVGPVPVIKGSPSEGALVLAGLCAAMWEAEDTDADGRLVLALSLEGLTAWYREAHRLTPVRDAVQFARNHAADRLSAAGRPVPPALS